MAFLVKFELEGDVRRTRVAELSFQSLTQGAHDIFKQQVAHGCQLKYVDEEGDLCTLTPDTFSDFEFSAAGGAPLKLKVFPCGATVAPTTAGSANVQQSQQASAVPPPTTTQEAAPIAQARLFEVPAASATVATNEESTKEESTEDRTTEAQVEEGVTADLAQPTDVVSSVVDWSSAYPGLMHPQQLIMQWARPEVYVMSAPARLQYVTRRGSDLHRALQGKAQSRPQLEALRDSLAPHPEFQQTLEMLDAVLQREDFEGVGEAHVSYLRTFTSLPWGQQREIAQTVMDNWRSKIAELLTKELEENPPSKMDNMRVSWVSRSPWARGEGPSPQDDTGATASDAAPPPQQQETQGLLRWLAEMGFTNEGRNRELLTRFGNNVCRVVEVLTSEVGHRVEQLGLDRGVERGIGFLKDRAKDVGNGLGQLAHHAARFAPPARELQLPTDVPAVPAAPAVSAAPAETLEPFLEEQAVPPPPTTEEVDETSKALQTLAGMGLTNEALNRELLVRHGNDLNKVVDELFQSA